MSDQHFRQKSLVLARQIYPHIDGDELITEADRIFKYLTKNSYNNMVGLNLATNDIVSFAEMMALPMPHNQMVPLSLYDYQRTALENFQIGNDCVLLSARGMGVTLMTLIYALWVVSYGGQNKEVMIMSHNRTTLHEYSRYLLALHKSSSILLPKIERYDNQTIRFENGNTINLITPSAIFIGPNVTHLIIQNANLISFANSDSVYSDILGVKEQVLMTGSAGANSGIFYDMYQSKLQFTNKIDWPYHLHPKRDAAWAARQKAQMGKELFETDYELKFYDLMT